MENARAERDHKTAHRIAVIGAGIGGLAAALRLAAAGCTVTVFETHGTPGGKMRTLPSAAGPVDAGPTVLTMRPVFDALFADVGEALEDHLTLLPLATLARHYWEDGTTLDLMADPEASAANVAAAFGPKAETQFRAFSARAARLFAAFDAPMMQAAEPSQEALRAVVLRQPRLIADMAPHRTLAELLNRSFDDPRLAQLFGRYATYVGGSPYDSPALLSLIWQAEAQGVWAVEGGMHRLAQVIEALASARGASFRYDTAVRRIEQQGGRVTAIETATERLFVDGVLFNGDPRALATGLLGDGVKRAVDPAAVMPRSLSAHVHAFAARPSGPALAHHTVFFGSDQKAEFAALSRGERPVDATLYICAQDRIGGAAPDGPERFEIILNGPPLTPDGRVQDKQDQDAEREIAQCQTQVFARLAQFGLRFDPAPGPETLTTPQGFGKLFPASLGSLYGRSPQGLMAALKRPVARTAVTGLYLAGGGVHPGAGVPMAALSGRHAAEAILNDLASTSTSRQTATLGGMSTVSRTTGAKPFRSSAS